jgi:hypothetical protein
MKKSPYIYMGRAGGTNETYQAPVLPATLNILSISCDNVNKDWRNPTYKINV